jgi:hypothetical protein
VSGNSKFLPGCREGDEVLDVSGFGQPREYPRVQVRTINGERYVNLRDLVLALLVYGQDEIASALKRDLDDEL